MDGLILIIAAAIAIAQLPDLRFPHPHIASARKRQQSRARYAEEARRIEERSQSERIRAVILSRLRDTELPTTEEAFHANR